MSEPWCGRGGDGGGEAASADRDAVEAALLARLGELGIAYVRYAHAPMFTVADGEALYAGMPGGHAKNLFLKDRKGALFLAVVDAATPVNMRALEKAVAAARLSFGRPELLAEILGVTPGSVTPFALMNAAPGRLTVLLDEALLATDPVHFHPMRNDVTLGVSAAGLLRFLEAAGYDPVRLSFRELAAAPI